MTYGNRGVLLAALPMALAFAGCSGNKGLSGRPDSGASVSGNTDPDSAVPLGVDAAKIDTGTAGVDGLEADAPGGGSVSPGPAQLTITPPAVDLGAIDVGKRSDQVMVIVTNTGGATSGPLIVTVSGNGITVIGCNGTTLAPKASCTITVTARLSVAGPISGTVEVGDSSANTKKIAVTGLVIGEGPKPSLTPNPLDLGSVLPGKTVKGTMTLSSAAPGLVVAISGTGFTVNPGTCTDSLPAGQTCTLEVSYTAGSTLGLARGTVTASQGGVSAVAAVTATVSGPARLVMTPTTATLQTALGSPSPPAIFYIANVGEMSSEAIDVAITGTDKDDFSATSSCPKTLPGGGILSCQVTVVYNPKTLPATNATATLTVTDSGPGGSSASSALTGTATPAGTPTLPWDQARLSDTGTSWWMNAQKGKFFISAKLRCDALEKTSGRVQTLSITGLVASKSGSTAVSLVPLPSELAGKWIYDPEIEMTAAGPVVAKTFDEATNYIDGGADPFYNSGKGYSAKVLAWANYRETPGDAAYYLDLRVWEMASAADAASLYTDLLQNALWSSVSWKTCQSGAKDPCP
jgi:hypothetical protein